jgi:hypothetical protein
MNYDRPPCREIHAHPAHEWGWGEQHCRGWTEREAATAKLIDQLNNLARRMHWEPDPATALFTEAKLECHPSVVNAMTQMVIPEFASFRADEPPVRPGIPVMINSTEMKPGTWRIVLADGKIG